MSDSNKLAELKRQRMLVHQHLQWLDREISKEQEDTEKPAIPQNRLEVELEATKREPIATQSETAPDKMTPSETATDIYEQLGPDSKSSAASAKTGCALIFAGAFVALGTLIAIIYYVY